MNLILYGSLINKKELEKEGVLLSNIEKVKVFGYKRIFNQEPSFRFVDSMYRAVLNIQEEREYWFNAIAIKNINDEYFKILDEREKGYDRILLDSNQVKTYEGKTINNCYVYIGKENKKNNSILPNQRYLEICFEGVKSFGEEFYNDFLNSTFQN